MITVAKVKLWDEDVGAVAWDEQAQVASFEYDKAFLVKGLDIAPIQMPISFPRIYSFGALRRDTFMGLPGLLADSLPDAYGKVMLDRWLNLNNRVVANPVERLCYQSNRGMGALELSLIVVNLLSSQVILSLFIMVIKMFISKMIQLLI